MSPRLVGGVPSYDDGEVRESDVTSIDTTLGVSGHENTPSHGGTVELWVPRK